MWKCTNCEEDVDDRLDVCWNCQTDTRGVRNSWATAEGENAVDLELKDFLNKKHALKLCAGCRSTLKFVGTKDFREGPDLGILSDLPALFGNNTMLEMYSCPSCLRVEFFLSEQ